MRAQLREARIGDEIAPADDLAEIGRIAGVPAMPGFTAPKLLWLARHEPDVLGRARHLLLPKDYVRFKLTGGFATDMCDASGTLLLDGGTGTELRRRGAALLLLRLLAEQEIEQVLGEGRIRHQRQRGDERGQREAARDAQIG